MVINRPLARPPFAQVELEVLLLASTSCAVAFGASSQPTIASKIADVSARYAANEIDDSLANVVSSVPDIK